MRPTTFIKFISYRKTSFGFTAVIRILMTVAILSMAAALSWSSGIAALAEPAHANVMSTIVPDETIIVTTLNDISDFSGSRQVGDLPGPDGRVSFREALTAANNTPGGQTIGFAIPVAEFWLQTNVALLKVEAGAFFLNDAGTTVDFSTQTTNIGDTNPVGPEVGMYGLEPNGWGTAALYINGDNNVIKGLGNVYQRGYAVRIVGNNNRVIGCQISGALHSSLSIEGYMGGPIPMANTIGGTGPGDGNILTGIRIGGPAENNVVIGNIIIGGGVTVIAAPQFGVFARNNRIGGPTVAERNVISGAGGYGEEGYPVGQQVSVIDAEGTIVEGNYIGTTVDGMARYPQQIGPIGVEVRDSRNTTVRGNLIAGLRTLGTNHYSGQIFGWAVLVRPVNRDSNGTFVEGNTIGLAADGVTPIVTRSGVTVLPMTANYHAFGTRISANHIARVETTGVVIGSQENGVTITGNSIHDSGLLGIDLLSGFAGTGGVTPNDPGDADVGGNGLQNYPVLQSAATTGSVFKVQGTLDSTPAGQFKLEFFSSPSCDPSGFGEGAKFLGSTTVTTDGAGQATFSASLPAAVPVGAKATATATRLSTGDTSEFSACASVASAPRVAPTSFDFDGDHKTDVSIFRPSDGTWWWNRSSDLVVNAAQFGTGTDKVVAADYTGDEKTDLAFFRPSTGQWFILRSEDSSFFSFPFGMNGDIPMPADYDGDGKADTAVFRPSNSTWYILRSSNGEVAFVRFGASGDQPVAGDYDGDGKADVAIFRPAVTGAEWWILKSNGSGVLAVQFGLQMDKAVAGDYTGDGKTDAAVWRSSNGSWYVLGSEDLAFYSFPFGTSTDLPAPGDYDGDGKTDAGVFRPSVSTWFIQRSTAGILITGFGLPTDQPVPSAFVR